jgi:hypothetical protein
VPKTAALNKNIGAWALPQKELTMYHVYFVTCDDLQQAVMSHGIAGRWFGNDYYKEFLAENGVILCWFVSDSFVLFRGEHYPTLVAQIPELVQWEDAVSAVGERIRELRALKDENAKLKKQLCIV